METSPGFKDYLPIRAIPLTTARPLMMSNTAISDAQVESMKTEWNQALNPRHQEFHDKLPPGKIRMD
jgi:hypothetical protein